MQFPEILLQEIVNTKAIDAENFLHAQSLPAVTSVRVNTKKSIDKFNKEEPVNWCTNAFYLKEKPNFALDPLWHAGTYYVQEASSMFLQHALKQIVNFNQPLRVLDLCAAPGGKSTLVANLLNQESLLIANEVIQARATTLSENLCKWGSANTWVSNSDPKYFSALPNYFDVILIDAPCSGSGLFRKDNSYINEWSQDNINLCAQRQQRIIQDVLPSLKSNGILIYMTCSFSQLENEGMNSYIINSGLEPIPITYPSNWGIVQSATNGYHFFPNLLKGEGFYLAAFQNTKDEVSTKPQKQASKTLKPNNKENTIWEQYLNIHSLCFLQEAENWFALPMGTLDDYYLLKSKIRLIRKGTFLGKIIKNTLLPEHDLAMSNLVVYPNKVDLSLTQTLQYLRKEDFATETINKGWHIATFENISLGWFKALGNRINNYYPNNYKLRLKQ